MAVYPASAAFLLIWLLLSLRNADNGIPMTIAVLPFGMFAALTMGGFSIILAPLLAILTIGLLILRRLSHEPVSVPVSLPSSGVFLLIFAAYSVFSAIVLVRLFQGQFLVFPMSVSDKGTQISIHFPSTMFPLQPTNSNIAQAVYTVLSSAFFLATVLVLRRRGTGLGEIGMAWGAGLNALLGVMDFLGLDSVLAFIRTADYSLLNEHTLGGFARIIGGFAEASNFGSFSAGFFAFFMMSFLIGRRPRDGVLALANLVCALISLSSTGIVSLAIALAFILLHLRTYLGLRMSRAFGHWFVIGAAGLAIIASLAIVLTPVMDLASDLLNRLIFAKSGSLSGLERGAWARSGLDVFVHTWGLGAGVGSLRANGLAAVLLGSVGLPGTIAFLGFLWHAIGRPAGTANRDVLRVFYAGRVCALTLLMSMLTAATGPDPTLFLIIAAALSVVARESGRAGTVAAGELPDQA